MSHRDVVVVGASTGGLQALSELVRGLPTDLPAAIFVVVHTSAGEDVLATILERAGTLPTETARNGGSISLGRIYVARRDHHLLLEPGRLRVVRGPRQNGFRPAVDPLFRSAAKAYGPRVIGVVLSGALDDGTIGLDCIKRVRGRAVAQEPGDAIIDSMPLSAIQNVNVDHIVPAAAMGPLLSRLVRETVPEGDEHTWPSARWSPSAPSCGRAPWRRESLWPRRRRTPARSVEGRSGSRSRES
jgi:two-component system, chemotaxis family, protein-glutamate methylesterase/glutaminase